MSTQEGHLEAGTPPGAWVPMSWPIQMKLQGSLKVVQKLTLSPNALKHISAYAAKSAMLFSLSQPPYLSYTMHPQLL